MRDKTAAISGGEVMPYLLIAVMRYGAAWTFVAHSWGNGLPAQDPLVGAICNSIAAAESPAAREKTFKKDGVGRTEAHAVVLRRRM